MRRTQALEGDRLGLEPRPPHFLSCVTEQVALPLWASASSSPSGEDIYVPLGITVKFQRHDGEEVPWATAPLPFIRLFMKHLLNI